VNKLSYQHLQEETQRAKKLTNIISLSFFFLAIILGIGFYFSNAAESLHWKLWVASPLFIVPIILNKLGFNRLSRLYLCILPVFTAMYLSISSKQWAIDNDIINPVNYFDVRIILLNAALVPLILFSLREKKLMALALFPSYTSLAFFDILHNAFGIGYYQSGLDSPDYYFSSNMFSMITIVFFTAVMIQLKRQVQKSDYKQLSENERTKNYLNELVAISNSSNINNGKVDEAKKEILVSVKSCLNVSRVSIWNFDNENESINCEYLLGDGKIECPGKVLQAKDYPTYFVELKYQQLIIARDAQNDAKTEEFKDDYLIPLDIYSMMDAPFLKKGKLGGVICCEHQGEYKEWGPAESLVLKALGDFLSYTIIVNERLKQNVLLQSQNEEITSINENLESMVKKRTQELEQKNKQLTEYAFINSHILRAPIARLSGLFNIFKMESNDTSKNPEILEYMEGSIEELKLVTGKINTAIEENGVINRRHLEE